MGITKLRGSAQIAGGSVDSYNIKNRSILPEDLAEGTFDGSVLTDGTVTTAKLADGSVTTEKLADGAVTAAKASDEITKAGNTFNGPGQLVELLEDGKLPILDGSNLTNLQPIEAISTEDLTDVGGAVNTPLGLAKYDSAGNLPLAGSVTTQGYAEFLGQTGIVGPTGTYGRLYYNTSDKYLHFVNEDGVDIALGVADASFATNVVPTPAVDGIETSFYLPVVPVEGSVCVYLNGMRLVPSYDYTMNGAFINMSYAPKAGWSLRVDYRY
jgi:hypothetical protein